jgi:hypothetical protein
MSSSFAFCISSLTAFERVSDGAQEFRALLRGELLQRSGRVPGFAREFSGGVRHVDAWK